MCIAVLNVVVAQRDRMEIKLGHCKQCGACCRYSLGIVEVIWDKERYPKARNDEYEIKKCQGAKFAEFSKDDAYRHLYYAIPIKKCRNLKKKEDKYYCKLHNTNKQTKTCERYPYYEDHLYYRVINTIFDCGYWFYDFEVECPQPLA